VEAGSDVRAQGTLATPARVPAVSAEFERLLDELAAQKATAVSLTNLWRVGLDSSPDQTLLNAQFLWRELRLRFAQRARQLSRLPGGLSLHPAVQEAIAVYHDVTARLVTCPKPHTFADEAMFAAVLRETKPSSILIPHKIGLALADRARTQPLSAHEQREVDKELDAFFMSRIGHRFLIQHYLASRDGRRRPGFSGIISGKCSPVDVIRDAAARATELVNKKCGACPEIEIIGDRQDTFTYLPSHIYFIAAELLKNACGATVRFRRLPSGELPAGTVLPPVRVIVARGEEDVAIKVEDQGGGIARSRLADVWRYKGYWSDDVGDDCLFDTVDAPPVAGGSAAPLAMHGLGLPLSRLYAKYFGGTLHLTPMEGYGTDCYVRLNRLGDHNCENLPSIVRMSPGESDSREERDAAAAAAGVGSAAGWSNHVSTGSLFDAQARR